MKKRIFEDLDWKNDLILRQCCRLSRCRSSLAEGKEIICVPHVHVHYKWAFPFPSLVAHISLVEEVRDCCYTEPCGLLLDLRAALIVTSNQGQSGCLLAPSLFSSKK